MILRRDGRSPPRIGNPIEYREMKALVLCYGTEIVKNNNKFVKLRECDEKGVVTGNTLLCKNLKGFSAGSVYSIEVKGRSDDGSIDTIKSSTKEWVADHKDAAAMQMTSRAVELAITAKNQQKKDSTNLIQDYLKPLRREYHSLNHQQRMAFELRILMELRK